MTVGNLSDGPNQETLFDSLRLGLKTGITIETVYGNLVYCYMVVTGAHQELIDVVNINKVQNSGRWKIDFQFVIGESQNKADVYTWQGVYDPKNRKGFFSNVNVAHPTEIPPNLFAALDKKSGRGEEAKIVVVTPGTRRYLGGIIFTKGKWYFDHNCGNAEAFPPYAAKAACELASKRYPKG